MNLKRRQFTRNFILKASKKPSWVLVDLFGNIRSRRLELADNNERD